MRYVRNATAVILFISVLLAAPELFPYSGGKLPEMNPLDSLNIIFKGDHPDADTTDLTIEEKNRRFYDSLAVRADRNFFSRTLYKLLIVPSTSGPGKKDPMNVVDETERYSIFEGKTIADIEIKTYNVFEKATSYLEKATNTVHVTTRERTIRRDVLFNRGDAIDANLLVINKQLLRSRQYIYDAEIFIVPIIGDSTSVNVHIVTHDSWTISVDGRATGFTGRASGDLYDANILGTGNKLKYTLSADWKKWKYEGSMFEYNIPNLFGTFFQANFIGGRSFWNTQYSARVNKRLIRESDYEAGAEYYNMKTAYYMLYIDPQLHHRSASINYNSYDAWAGKSFSIPSIQSSVYAMARYYNIQYGARTVTRYDEALGTEVTEPLEVGKGLNPLFHNGGLYLGTAGIYREKFLTTNLLYGYGFSEYIGTGYRAELTGGYQDGEYDKGIYGGISFKFGNFTPIGYFLGDISVGSFYNTRQKDFYRSALNLKINYFTNLMRAGQANIRQFLTLNYVKGWNREEGVDEWIRLTNLSGPRNVSVNTPGRERLVLNTETVVFTPWQPLGFRIALYGFADIGLIGNDRNVFRNDLYSTIGIGIRMKNEMFVFGTIQISLCVALSKQGLLRNDNWFMLTDEQRMQTMRYIPYKPEIVEYR